MSHIESRKWAVSLAKYIPFSYSETKKTTPHTGVAAFISGLGAKPLNFLVSYLTQYVRGATHCLVSSLTSKPKIWKPGRHL